MSQRVKLDVDLASGTNSWRKVHEMLIMLIMMVVEVSMRRAHRAATWSALT